MSMARQLIRELILDPTRDYQPCGIPPDHPNATPVVQPVTLGSTMCTHRRLAAARLETIQTWEYLTTSTDIDA